MTSTCQQFNTDPAGLAGHFGDLVRELLDLDFEPEITDDGALQYTHPDHHVRALLRRENDGAATALVGGQSLATTGVWDVRLPESASPVTQIVAFYGVLNPDPRSAVEGIACTYHVEPFSAGTILAATTA
ncbi:hypothetical protein [Longispora albida]|uniref:hypothetical protein n=1 Tax=Longispora albida TaxID=203523 RepID=UPI00035FDCAC|nr:hypothetical protein [Longispora albida]